MIPRLFIDAHLAAGERVAVDRAQAHYLSRVLRLDAGAALRVFNGGGGAFAAQIVRADKKRLEIEIGAFYPDRAPRLHIHLGQGVFESGKMDWAIEKITELGATAVHPLICRQNAATCRPLRTPGGARAAVNRWRRVAVAACQQCGRNIPPAIAAPQTADEWFAQIPPDAARLLFTPSGGGGGAKAILKILASSPSAPPVVFALIGPRAGLTEAEEASARAAGFVPVTLGARILRVETAAIAVVAVLQTVAGDFS